MALIPTGRRVKVAPGPNEVQEREGVVAGRIQDERDEYMITIADKVVRMKRNRITLADVDARLGREPEEGFVKAGDGGLRAKQLKAPDLTRAQEALLVNFTQVCEASLGVLPRERDTVAAER